MADFFLGITLPDEFAAEVENWRRRFAAPKTAPHITLIPPFSWSGTDQDLEEVISKSLEGISPFEIRAEGIGRFGRRVIYIDVELSQELLRVYQRVAAGLESRGVALEDRPYKPHITLATRLSPGEFSVYMEELGDYAPSETFPCQQVALFKMRVDGRKRQWQVIRQIAF